MPELFRSTVFNQKRRFLRACDEAARKLDALRFESMNYTGTPGLSSIHAEIEEMIERLRKFDEMVSSFTSVGSPTG